MLNYTCAYKVTSHLPITPMLRSVLKLWPQALLSALALVGNELSEQGCSLLNHAVTTLNRCAPHILYLCISPLKALQSHVGSSQNTAQLELSSVFRVRLWTLCLCMMSAQTMMHVFQLASCSD